MAPADRLPDVLQAAIDAFIARGYARTQIDDVATAAGVAKGTVYRYVESKEALFDAALRYADGRQLPDEKLPLPTPKPEQTLAFLGERVAVESEDLVVVSALARRRITNPPGELETVIRDFYGRAYRNRTTIKLVDRCAQDHPRLAAVWFEAARWAQHRLLADYLQRRMDAGHLRGVLDVDIAARVVIETIAFWAVHRHWDPAPQSVVDEVAEDCVVDLLVAMFDAGGGR